MSRMSEREMARRDMRDRARRDRDMADMARRMGRDYARDGRNPYGSKGGYVGRRRRDRDMADMYMDRDMDMDMDMDMDNNMGDYDSDFDMDSAGYDGRNDYGDYRGQDYQGNDMDYQRDRQSDRHKMPFRLYGSIDMQDMARKRNYYSPYVKEKAMNGHYSYPPLYMRDFASSEKLDKEDLKKWYEQLCEEIPEQYKSLYKKDKIEEIAEQMQISFKKYEPMELVVATVMIATDYPKSIGYADINRNVAMAKEWLEDKDSNVKGSEKLSAYYDNVIKG